MPAVKKYTRINFQNYPSTSTPLNATNLNKMDKGIDDLDDDLVSLKNTIENMSFDADAISYDNTQSGLQATDVQGAMDEINNHLTANSNPFIFSYDSQNDQYGYTVKVGGADTFFPFKKGIDLIGTYTGNQTINVSNYKKSGDTVNNFIIEIVKVNGTTTGTTHMSSKDVKVTSGGMTPSKSLSGNNLVITGCNMTITAVDNDAISISGNCSLNYKVWHV